VDWDEVPDDAKTLAARKKELRVAAVDRIERLFTLKALRSADWNISAAARAVGMKRPNLHALMRKHRIAVPKEGRAMDDAEQDDTGPPTR